MDHEEDISHLLESQLKCLISLPAESALDFSDTPPEATTHPTDADKYETYERVAIQILDSEFMDYPTGELEGYLLEYLARLPCKPE